MLEPDIGSFRDHTATILLVEDEVLNRMALAVYLQECGFRILEASNADEAVLALAMSEMPVDLVFSDVRLPGGMDGFGLTRWIHAERPDLPVILTSGAGQQTEAAGQHCANEAFVAKPYDPKAVVAEIVRALDAREQAFH